MSDSLPSAEKPRSEWLAPFTLVSLILGVLGVLSVTSMFYVMAFPMRKEDYVAPESVLAEAYAGAFYMLAGGVFLILGVIVALVVNLAKRPLSRLDRWTFRANGAALILSIAGLAVAFLLRRR